MSAVSPSSHLGSGDTTAFLTSLFTHLVLVITVAQLPYVKPILEDRMTLVIPSDVDSDELEVDETFELTVSEDEMSDVGAISIGEVEDASAPTLGEMPHLPDPMDVAEATVEVSGSEDPMDMFSNDRDLLLDEIAGLPGAVVTATSDVGSVNQITMEILARLEESEVLVVWLMDASESLRGRREQIIQHFDRVYQELDELADDAGDALLTGVAAFGKELVPMLPEPTADRSAIQQAVRQIKADESGIENVFSAIKATATACSKYTRLGRKAMIIVVTDEMGNDLPVLDEANQIVQRHQIGVYVMGPLAPFGTNQVKVKWTDKETGEVFYLPVDRGPETAQPEHATLALWEGGPGTSVFSSGFGPYGLTRIAHENGGLYLVHDDGSIRGPNFENQNLAQYHPDYTSPAAYARIVGKNPLRAAVLKTAKATNQLLEKPLPTLFLAAGIQFEIRDVKNELAKTGEVLHQGLKQLRAVQKHRPKELSKRWQAHYDLLMGRLLVNLVRGQSYAQALEEMFKKPRLPKGGTKNAWRLVGDNEKSRSSSDKQDNEADFAREQLQRVIDEHANTPWAAVAKNELAYPLRFHWQEDFKEPPEGVPLPWDKKPWKELTEAQKKAKTDFERKKKVKQERKVEREKKAAEIKLRPPPKL